MEWDGTAIVLPIRALAAVIDTRYHAQ
jgi:hypothetical protein